ncbi:MAG: hypothetical protein D3916_09640 [Candidatus Electrothrix sp. MAN1_4]|nr:hypothetical protein [Candidatus Electrothrix sp. MAN1_4]
MNSHLGQEIIFTWWNTSIAPSAKSRSSHEDDKYASNVIEFLSKIKGADFIALGEVSESYFKFLEGNCKLEGYSFHKGVSQVGKTKFDTCYLARDSKISIIKISNIVRRRGNSTLKIAQKIDVVIEGYEVPFHIFVSHWSSRLWCPEECADRHALGVYLRDPLDELIDEYQANPFIILIGDYNDEPFAQSLSHHVMASRDIDLVSERTHLFYNPFWKCLGYSLNSPKYAGSYFFKKGNITQWYTFDQVIFSHAFVKGNEWKLSNQFQQIVDVPEYLKKIKDRKSIFDHLPVSGKIERKI